MGVHEGANKSLSLGSQMAQVAPPHGRQRQHQGAWRARVVAASIAALLPLLAASWVQARESGGALGTVKLSALPSEAQTTDRLIHAGGPFPYPKKDGTVFGNRERILPKRPRGDYREYTVKTPGSRDRGARRIVCAGQQPTAPEVCYYTADHYSSFQRIVR